MVKAVDAEDDDDVGFALLVHECESEEEGDHVLPGHFRRRRAEARGPAALHELGGDDRGDLEPAGIEATDVAVRVGGRDRAEAAVGAPPRGRVGRTEEGMARHG